MAQLAAVAFDMDGTMVETESLWYQSEVRTMAHFGFEWTHQDQQLSLGGPFDQVAEYMANKTGVDIGEIARELVTEIETLMTAAPLRIQPGAVQLHEAVRAAGLPTALVSNSWRVLVDLVIETLGVDFDAVVAGDEVMANKPDPVPYLRACELMGTSPAATVVIEDSPTGVASATAAGCCVVAIPHVSAIEPAPGRLIVSSLEQISVPDLRELVSGSRARSTP